MEEYISIEKLIKEAKKAGLDLGKGDPYNRLRYYTKMGWLPNMKRLKDGDSTSGHYPADSLEKLQQIQKLKGEGLSNELISERMQSYDKVHNLMSTLRSPIIRTRIIIYASFFILVFVLMSELGVIRIGKDKTDFVQSAGSLNQTPTVLDSGKSFVAGGKSSVLVNSVRASESTKIIVTFNDNYEPATRYWVSDVIDGKGFILTLELPVNSTSDFSWWIVE